MTSFVLLHINQEGTVLGAESIWNHSAATTQSAGYNCLLVCRLLLRWGIVNRAF